MALASVSNFASFDVVANTSIQDISAFLSEALILEFDLLGDGLTVDLADPVDQRIWYWNQENLNSNQGTVSGSITSVATSLVLSTGHGARFAIGDLIYVDAINTTEVMQVTAISTDTLTITRGFNSTAQASIADAATVVRMPASQEFSDYGTSRVSTPTAYSNRTQIVEGGDIGISGSTLAINMATQAYDVARQIALRVTELKRYWSTIALYGELSGAPSDTVYGSTGGFRYWARDQGGIVNTTSEALAWGTLNTDNLTGVNRGSFADTLVIPPGLVGSLVGIDSSLRRVYETDKKVGYTVNVVTLAQGNDVKVIVDGRVKTGDYFMYSKANVRLRPLMNRGMFVIAATDFTDGVKRRVLSEMGVEVRQPTVMIYGRNKT